MFIPGVPGKFLFFLRLEIDRKKDLNGLLVVSGSGPAVTSNWAVCCTMNPPVLPLIPPEGVKVPGVYFSIFCSLLAFIMVRSSNSEDLISNLDLGNPFHLQNSDFSSNTIIFVKLTGTENYRVWAAAMKLAINTRNKTGFIDGSCVKYAYASSATLSNQWEMCNSIVLYWLLNSVSVDLFLGQIFSDNVAEVWAELKKTYNKLDGSLICYKKSMGLSKTIRSSLLSIETLPDVKDAFAIVPRKESHRGITSSFSDSVYKPQVFGFVAKSNNWPNNGNKRGDNKKFGNIVNGGNNKGPNLNLLCTNCGKVGHTINRCFDIIGNPPRYNKNPCPKQSDPKLFNANSASSSNEKSATLSFTSEQMMKLMNLINEDLLQNQIVETGSENGGLYSFDSPFNSNCQSLGNHSVMCFTFKSLWHTRLGHPSDQAVDVLQHDLNFTKDSRVSPCDICHKAKQTREPFSISNYQTTVIGELIHLDLWGLYKVIIKPCTRGFNTSDGSEADFATSMGDNPSSEGNVPSFNQNTQNAQI
ncbi:ribonuclease H-like domain-containing protein [Tanacetum coccineum]